MNNIYWECKYKNGEIISQSKNGIIVNHSSVLSVSDIKEIYFVLENNKKIGFDIECESFFIFNNKVSLTDGINKNIVPNLKVIRNNAIEGISQKIITEGIELHIYNLLLKIVYVPKFYVDFLYI